MKLSHLACTLAAVSMLTASGFSQTSEWTPRKINLATAEGDGYCYMFGRYMDMRFQIIDEQTFPTTGVKEIAMRSDARPYPYTAAHGMGRKWASVVVAIGDAVAASAATTVFTSNFASAPTKVYSAPTKWPTVSGTVSGPGPITVKFPFKTPLVTKRTPHILDFTFTGGSLANGSTQTYGNYYLDGARFGSYGFGPYTYYGKAGGLSTAGCVDSTSTSTYTPYCYMPLYSYGPTYSSTSYRNSHRAYIYGYYYPPATPVVNIVGMKDDPGIVFPGVTCQNALINLGLPTVVLGAVSNSSTSSYTNFYNYFLGTSTTVVPYNAAWVGLKIAVQTAWADKGDSSLKLSRAAESVMPPIPLYQNYGTAGRATIYGYSTYAYKYNGTSTAGYYCPAVRYTW